MAIVHGCGDVIPISSPPASWAGQTLGTVLSAPNGKLVFRSQWPDFWLGIWTFDAVGDPVSVPSGLSVSIYPLSSTNPDWPGGLNPYDYTFPGLDTVVYSDRFLSDSDFLPAVQVPASGGMPGTPSHLDYSLAGDHGFVNVFAIPDPLQSSFPGSPPLPATRPTNLGLYRVEAIVNPITGNNYLGSGTTQWGVYFLLNPSTATTLHIKLTTHAHSNAHPQDGPPTLAVPLLETQNTLPPAPNNFHEVFGSHLGSRSILTTVQNRGTGTAQIDLAQIAAQYAAGTVSVVGAPGTLTVDQSEEEEIELSLTIPASSLTLPSTDTNTTTPPHPLTDTLETIVVPAPPVASCAPVTQQVEIAEARITVGIIRIMLVLDQSGSMGWQETNNTSASVGSRRWDHMKTAVSTLVSGLTAMAAAEPSVEVHLGMVLFSGQYLQDADLLVPIANVFSLPDISNLLDARNPRGGTPIRAGLQLALNSLNSGPNDKNWILLLSDGAQTEGDARGILASPSVNFIGVAYGPNPDHDLLTDLRDEVEAAGRDAVFYDAALAIADPTKANDAAPLSTAFVNVLSTMGQFDNLNVDPLVYADASPRLVELPPVDDVHEKVFVWVTWRSDADSSLVDRLSLHLLTPRCERVDEPIDGLVWIARGPGHILFTLSRPFLRGNDIGQDRYGTYRLGYELVQADNGGQLPISWQMQSQTRFAQGRLEVSTSVRGAGAPVEVGAHVPNGRSMRDFALSGRVLAPETTWDQWVLTQPVSQGALDEAAEQLREQGITDFFEILDFALAASGRIYRPSLRGRRLDYRATGKADFASSFDAPMPGSYDVVTTLRGETQADRGVRAERQVSVRVPPVGPWNALPQFEPLDDKRFAVHVWLRDRNGNFVWRDVGEISIDSVGVDWEGASRPNPFRKCTTRVGRFGASSGTDIDVLLDGNRVTTVKFNHPGSLEWADWAEPVRNVANAENATGPYQGQEAPFATVDAGGRMWAGRSQRLPAESVTVFLRTELRSRYELIGHFWSDNQDNREVVLGTGSRTFETFEVPSNLGLLQHVEVRSRSRIGVIAIGFRRRREVVEGYRLIWDDRRKRGYAVLELDSKRAFTFPIDDPSAFEAVGDLLRYEKPVHLSREEGRIYTGFEEVGEGET